jgi:N-acyl-phosphatidylethanolamine-hydrolysing phospholipase D
VTWIGHSTLLIEMDGVRFLTDPIWSKRASPIPWLGPARLVEPGIAFDDLPAIDFVLISHNHYDHLDLPTLERLAERDPNVTFYVPLGNADLLRSRGIARVEELDWTERAIFSGVEIHCLPAQHWSKRSMTDDLETLWSSWAVIGPERRFYFAGDTGYFGGFAEVGDALGPFDLAAVPIGAYEPSELMRLSHMDPEEALRAAIDLGARTAVAIHFGTFELTDEPLAEPPQRFLTAASGQSPSLLTAWVLSIGEIRQF